jgi:autoinducer 2-degrading protein
MRLFFQLTICFSILAALFGQSAHAQGSAVYVATYVEVMPNAVPAGAALLKHYREISRKQDGNLGFEVLQEIARPNRFAIVEGWKDKAALDAHATAAGTVQFRDKLKAIEDAPYDERVSNALHIGEGKSRDRPGAIYVLTHVDVLPTGKDDCIAAVKAMSADTANDPGNIRYEVLQQTSRANHFTVVEAWTDRKALDAHAMAAHTRAFRAKLAPLAGALYDERFYKALE